MKDLAYVQLRLLRLWKKTLVEYVKPRRADDGKAKPTVTEADMQLSELFDWFEWQLQEIKPDVNITAFFEILQSIQTPFEVSLSTIFITFCDALYSVVLYITCLSFLKVLI